jgi:hypothetical protein
MKHNNIHEPIINASDSACTCYRWSGPVRRDGEALGVFTFRAKQAHDAHLADAQRHEVQQTTMFEPRAGLFESEAGGLRV